ncbi:MAG: hypothetical protein HY240_06090 [Actinobacteria bacterium]|nr:hypothetical protein [Actinomycetota bacterium]
MVRRAVAPSLLAVPVAVALGWVLGGPGVAVSAAVGVGVVFANFAASGLSLAWASTISIPVVQGVALGGFVVRLGLVVGLLFALRGVSWFSPLAFALAVVPGTILLLAFEARLTIRGAGAALDIPADPSAVLAAEALAAREA